MQMSEDIKMAAHEVTIFKPYPLSAGQKITIADGPRKGDWLVTDVTEHKVMLRCPVSGHKVEWDRFCYAVETRTQDEWPVTD